MHLWCSMQAWAEAHLLPSESPDPEFPDFSVYIPGTATLSVLQLLQVVQGTGQAKGCAVEVAPPDGKGEEELAGEDQLTAPAGQGIAADGQHILQASTKPSVRATGACHAVAHTTHAYALILVLHIVYCSCARLHTHVTISPSWLFSTGF